MSLSMKIKRELGALAVAVLYFGSWVGALLLFKRLLLAEYQIHSYGVTAALVGVLVLAKVVLVLDHVRLGKVSRSQPAWVDVLLRTALYTLGVVVVMSLEHVIKGWRGHGGLGAGVKAAMEETNLHHFYVNALCVTGALLGYNTLAVVRRRLGDGAMIRMLLEPLPEGPEPSPAAPIANTH